MTGKSSTGAKSYDYFGTLIAAISYGALDKLFAVIVDGKTIYENTSGLARSGNSTDLTGSVDPKYFTNGGYLKIYWGTSAQTLDAALAGSGHADYKNIAHLVAFNFLFGREKSTAPNVEVIAARLPVCDTSLCAGGDNVFDDGQVNPVAALGEIFTSGHGCGLEVSRLDATTWAAAGSYAYTNRATCFCSPLFTDHGDLRTAVAALLQHFDGALAWTSAGKLALKLLKFGTDPGGLTTLDANHFTAPPRLTLGGWGDVPTGFVLRYFDRDRKFKEADEKLDNLVALHVRGEDDRRSIDFPHVTRRTQILALAAQAVRRQMHPEAIGELIVRRAFADKYPGDKLKVDVDPEPGGAGTAQLGIVTERRDEGLGPVKLRVKFDPLAASAPYTPTFTPTNPEAADVGAVVYALALPLPGARIGLVAARPAEDVVGFRAFFATDNAGDFTELGLQPGFAVRCSLDANVTADDTTLRLTLLDGPTGPDAYLAERTAGTAIEAAQDILLAVIADVDGNGRVTVDSDGTPKLELCSVVSRAAVDSDTHDYTVLRARKGLAARAWNTGGGTKAWIIPGESLIEWSHEYMGTLLRTAAVGYFRLAPFTAYAEQTTGLLEISFVFPSSYIIPPVISWTTPNTANYTLASTGLLTPDATITDADGNLVRVELFSRNSAGVLTGYFDLAVAATGSTTLQDCMAAAGLGTSGSIQIDLGTQTSADQYFTLTIRATDSTGAIVESSRNLILPGSSSAGLGGVNFNPWGDSYLSPLTVVLTVGGSATKIEYKLTTIGSAAPTSGTTVYTGTSKTLSITLPKRLWARAKDNGANVSAWQFEDYFKETNY